MTAELKWIHISLFLIAVLQFTAAAEEHRGSVTVRVGDDVSLPCEHAVENKHKCDSYTWLFSALRNKEAVELVKLGEIKHDKPASDRLNVLKNCSLIIKEVTVKDVGHYTCREYTSDKQGSDSVVHLSVINMTEHKNTDMVTLNCSVWTNEGCTLKVQWLYHDKDLDKDNNEIKISQSGCSAFVKFLSSHYIYPSRYEFFKCKVTDGDKEQLFDFIPQPSGEKPGEDKTTTSTTTTTTSTSAAAAQEGWWWLCIVGAVVSVALLMIVVKVVRGRRTEGNKSRTNDSVLLTSNPAGTQPPPPGSSQDTADCEDGVSYASISFSKKTSSEAQVLEKDEDVTYTTVKASSSSAGASEDIHNLYATVNK